MELTIKQAAKKVKISHQTLRNHVKEGRVSAAKTVKGIQVIDSSELARVYPDSFKSQNLESKKVKDFNQLESDLTIKVKVLEAENKALLEKIEYLNKAIAKSEQREQQFFDLARHNGKLLEHHTQKEEQPAPKKKSWFFR